MKSEMTIIERPVNEIVSINPYDRMVELALSSDVGIEKLEKLLELKERHEANEARKSYNVAMSEFKKQSLKIIKDKKGHNSSYATLANIIDVVTPVLGDFGLSLSWRTTQEGTNTTVTAIISHIDGYSENTSLTHGLETSGNKSNIHGLGSTISYLERYTAKAILGIAEKDQDNDGQVIQPKANPIVLSKEFKDLMETKSLFPDLYDKMISNYGGEPTTKPDCIIANDYIKSIVDVK